VLLNTIIVVVAVAVVSAAVLYGIAWRNMDWAEKDRDRYGPEPPRGNPFRALAITHIFDQPQGRL
jgi:hypothetical protein